MCTRDRRTRAVLVADTGEVRVCRLRMAPPVEVVGFLEGLGAVRAVYEAGPTGFALARAARERTSDTKRRQGSITKAGSGHARRLLVEAAQHYRYPPRIGPTLARRQAGQDPRVIAIAWRAQRRLHQRWQHPGRPSTVARGSRTTVRATGTAGRARS